MIVIKTDKSSRFAVCSEDAYLKMGKVHTQKDKVIKRDNIVEIENCSMLIVLPGAKCSIVVKIMKDHRYRPGKSCKSSSSGKFIALQCPQNRAIRDKG